MCGDGFKECYGVNALRDLQHAPITDWFYEPLPDEVHYTAGVLPIEGVNGIVIDEDLMRDDEQYGNFVRADLILKKEQRCWE